MEKYFLLFMTYSILGWIMEVTDKFITKGKFINRGFLIGPYCPIYGWGALIMTLTLTRYVNDKLVLFIMAIVVCSILEYATSYVMEKMFHIRWWDYSNDKFNINGRISLSTMIPFGILGVLGICYSNPFFFGIFDMVPDNILTFCTVVLAMLFIIDNILSFRIIYGLVDIVENVKSDSTEKVTAQVKQIILKGNRALYTRLISSFPMIKIFKNFKK